MGTKRKLFELCMSLQYRWFKHWWWLFSAEWHCLSWLCTPSTISSIDTPWRTKGDVKKITENFAVSGWRQYRLIASLLQDVFFVSLHECRTRAPTNHGDLVRFRLDLALRLFTQFSFYSFCSWFGVFCAKLNIGFDVLEFSEVHSKLKCIEKSTIPPFILLWQSKTFR